MIKDAGGRMPGAAVVGLLPPMVRASLFGDEEFKTQLGLQTETVVKISGSSAHFSQRDLFAAFRHTLSRSSHPAVLEDEGGRQWTMSAELQSTKSYVCLSTPGSTIRLPFPWPLSPNRDLRLSWFEQEARRVCLAPCSIDHWRGSLSRSPLSDEQYERLKAELESSVGSLYQHLLSQLEAGSTTIETLCPSHLGSYQVLMGDDGTVSRLEDFIGLHAKKRLEQYVRTHGLTGVKYMMPLSSHSQITSQISLERLTKSEINAFFEWVSEKGDLVSMLGAFELGVQRLDRDPGIEVALEKIAEVIFSDDPDDANGRFQLLSAVFVMIDGSAALSKLVPHAAPFWRRCASFAYAALVERALISCTGSWSEFCHWAYRNRAQHFFQRSLADMRLEPRWQPDLISPSQLKAEFVVRTTNAAILHEPKIRSASLRALLFEEKDCEVKVKHRSLNGYFPGPLEGGVDLQEEMPGDLLEQLNELVVADQINVDVFHGLINSALLFRISAVHAEIAIKAIQKDKYQIAAAPDMSIHGLLVGLGLVAAASRNPELSVEIRTAARIARRNRGAQFEKGSEFQVAMMASAAYEDFNDWAHFLGGWLEEIALEVDAVSDAKTLLDQLDALTLVEPAFSKHSCKAHAALSAAASI